MPSSVLTCLKSILPNSNSIYAMYKMVCLIVHCMMCHCSHCVLLNTSPSNRGSHDLIVMVTFLQAVTTVTQSSTHFTHTRGRSNYQVLIIIIAKVHHHGYNNTTMVKVYVSMATIVCVLRSQLHLTCVVCGRSSGSAATGTFASSRGSYGRGR